MKPTQTRIARSLRPRDSLGTAVAKHDLAVASYGLLQGIGRLDVETLKLSDAAYDADAHYEEVRRKWFGISITRADGRQQEMDAADAQSEPEAQE